jgi:uracil-DNA glycosylase
MSSFLTEQIPSDWNNKLQNVIHSDGFKKLESYLEQEYQSESIFPPKNEIFKALEYTSFDNVKVVILGQDPYHGEGQAHGLAFSVKRPVKTPPSLKNIYKEIQNEFGHPIPLHGQLDHWAKQGVLLLNNVLTVREKKPASHQKKGWEEVTNSIIELLANEKENLVFLLWGSPAQKKAKMVNDRKHLLLKSVHPSPLSAYRGFFETDHFKQANEYLKENGKSEIDWSIPN